MANIIGPVEQKKKLMTGKMPMSQYGEGKVMFITIRVIPPFCMAVSNEIAMIWKRAICIVNNQTSIQNSSYLRFALSGDGRKGCSEDVTHEAQACTRYEMPPCDQVEKVDICP